MAAQLLCTLVAVLLIGMVAMASALRVVPEYQRLVLFRLGRALDKPGGPGLVFLIPIVDRAVKVDLREQKHEMSQETATTKDYKSATFALRWYYKVLDPVQSVLQVGNHETAIAEFAKNKFREIIHDTNSVDLLSDGERIRFEVNTRLDEITRPWGVKVTKLEIVQLALDDNKKDMETASLNIHAVGESQTPIHVSGTVAIGNQSWDAMSDHPIPPNRKVRVKRVLLEVEEDDSE